MSKHTVGLTKIQWTLGPGTIHTGNKKLPKFCPWMQNKIQTLKNSKYKNIGKNRSKWTDFWSDSKRKENPETELFNLDLKKFGH